MNVAPNVRKLRKEAGWSKQDLADAAGLSSVRVIEITGRAHWDTLEQIAAALTRKLGRTITVSDLIAEPQPRRKSKAS